MEKLYTEELVSKIKRDIIDKKFSSKDELISYLRNLPTEIANDEVLVERIANGEVEVNLDYLDSVTNELVDYYDKSIADISSLNMEGVSKVNIGNQEYLKVASGDGSYTVMNNDFAKEDSISEQFQNRQDMSESYQTNNGKENVKEISSSMAEEKVTANLVNLYDLNMNNLTPEEKERVDVILKALNVNEVSLIVDPSKNVFINKDTGDTYYVHKNENGVSEVRKANEVVAKVESKETAYIGEDGEEHTATVEYSEEEAQFEQLSDYELQYIVENKTQEVDSKTLEIINRILERRKKQNKEVTNNLQPAKQYVKIVKPSSYRIDGFTSIVFLCTITSIYGIIVLLYIFITNGILK